MIPTYLWWSSGKDSAWTLHRLQQSETHQVVGLITSINEQAQRVAMHGVRCSVLRAQAKALGLPLKIIRLPCPCSNADYEAAVAPALTQAVEEGVQAMAFGDLFLEDVRDYRLRMLDPLPFDVIFPLWGSDTQRLAAQMVAGGLKANISCLDPKQLAEDRAGARFDSSFLADLPDAVDPCGENGEFHTLCWDGPMFQHPLSIAQGETVQRDGFVFTDWMLTQAIT